MAERPSLEYTKFRYNSWHNSTRVTKYPERYLPEKKAEECIGLLAGDLEKKIKYFSKEVPLYVIVNTPGLFDGLTYKKEFARNILDYGSLRGLHIALDTISGIEVNEPDRNIHEGLVAHLTIVVGINTKCKNKRDYHNQIEVYVKVLKENMVGALVNSRNRELTRKRVSKIKT